MVNLGNRPFLYKLVQISNTRLWTPRITRPNRLTRIKREFGREGRRLEGSQSVGYMVYKVLWLMVNRGSGL